MREKWKEQKKYLNLIGYYLTCKLSQSDVCIENRFDQLLFFLSNLFIYLFFRLNPPLILTHSGSEEENSPQNGACPIPKGWATECSKCLSLGAGLKPDPRGQRLSSQRRLCAYQHHSSQVGPGTYWPCTNGSAVLLRTHVQNSPQRKTAHVLEEVEK